MYLVLSLILVRLQTTGLGPGQSSVLCHLEQCIKAGQSGSISSCFWISVRQSTVFIGAAVFCSGGCSCVSLKSVNQRAPAHKFSAVTRCQQSLGTLVQVSIFLFWRSLAQENDIKRYAHLAKRCV